MFYVLYIIILYIFYIIIKFDILISKFIQYLCYNEYILILFLAKEKISNLIIFIIRQWILMQIYIFIENNGRSIKNLFLFKNSKKF